MSELTRHHLDAAPAIEDTLATVTAAAVEYIDGVDYADVMLVRDEQFESRAPTAALVIELDAAQLRLNEGPCLHAALTDTVVHCPNLSDDERWPRFAAAAVDAGVNRMTSFPLYRDRRGGGALNLMGRDTTEVDREGHAIAAMLATHAAIALITADRLAQFQTALASRDLIGQAKGVVMERFDLDADAAFKLITRLSQNTNTPIRTLAGQITTGPPTSVTAPPKQTVTTDAPRC
ncbi:ANTAR domain-containing protein [Mycobacterium hodleri]|uniref:ANTAR domain-containing protein n=2 Tax=Mycolicibacterium hodleri TaxID=49897 RepID=A0A502DTX1_9MYCO|nr:ANTAR domain-containing protein [Mycolicibacterium hodleri]